MEESTNEKPEKFTAAVLSTTFKSQMRAKRIERQRAEAEAAAAKDAGDAMETDDAPAPAAETEKMDVDEDKKEGDEKKEDDKEGDSDKKKRAEKEKVGYELSNLSRVLPEQLKSISFAEDGRYEPVKKVFSHHPRNFMGKC